MSDTLTVYTSTENINITITEGGGGGMWGTITGRLSSQTDLWRSLSAKALAVDLQTLSSNVLIFETFYQNASSNIVFNTAINNVTGNWNSAYASTTALNLSSVYWNNTYKNQSKYLPLSGGQITGNIQLVSTATNWSPLGVSAYNLSDGIGILNLEGSEPDINFNQVGGTGYNTFTFSREGDAKLAIGRNSSNDLYITRITDTNIYDDAFILSHTSGDVSIAGGNIGLNYDGSAYFAGAVSIGSSYQLDSYGLNATSSPIQILAQNWNINSDGEVGFHTGYFWDAGFTGAVQLNGTRDANVSKIHLRGLDGSALFANGAMTIDVNGNTKVNSLTTVNQFISPVVVAGAFCGTTGNSYYYPDNDTTYPGGIGGCINVNGGSTYGAGAVAGKGGRIDVSGTNSNSDGAFISSPGADGGCIIMTGGSPGGTDSGNFPGKGGCIIAIGGSSVNGNTNYGGHAGCLIFNGGNGNGDGASYIGGGGGILNMSGGNAASGRDGYNGGSIITCNGGGNIDTTGQGCIGLGSTYTSQQTLICGTASGYNQTLHLPDTAGIGGTIALRNSNPSIISNAFCGTSRQGGIGGYVDVSPDSQIPVTGGDNGNGGYFIAAGGYNEYGGGAGNGGTINISGGSNVDVNSGPAGDGGCVILTGSGSTQNAGSAAFGGKGGCIISYGNIYTPDFGETSANGGSLIMSAGNGVDGGSISTAYGGGSINTSSGGGSIDTTGTGYIELGNYNNNRQTKLQGTVSSGHNQTLSLPDTHGVGGTIALLSDIANSNNWDRAYTNISNLSSLYLTVTAVSGTANQINASYNKGTVTLSLPTSTVFPGDVAVIGNLTVAGSATYVNTKNLVVGDNLIYFNDNNYGSNVLDIGLVAHFSQAPLGYNHTGLVRRAGGQVPGVWTLFSGLTTEPLSASNIDWTDKNIRIDSLSANLIGNVTGNADTVTNGVYTNGSYSDPSWITTLSDTKLIGTKFATNTAVNILTGTLVTNTTFNNYQTNVGAATATLLPTTAYQNSSGSFATNTLLQSTSALLTPLTLTNVLTSQLVLNTAINNLTGNWNSAYASTTALNLSSNRWNEVYSYVGSISATNNPTYNATNFAKLSAQVYQAGSGTNVISTIFGSSTANGSWSNIAGGCCHINIGNYSTIGGGICNTLSGTQLPFASVIAGGSSNIISNDSSFVGGGVGNKISGSYSSIIGGGGNTVSGNSSSIVGGGFFFTGNKISGNNSFIGGGECNNISGNYSSVLGGCCNDTKGFTNTFILGSNLNANQANFTYVNNLSSQGLVYDQSSNSALWTTIITNVTATGSTTISNPAGSYQDGQRLLYRVTQGGSGNNAITLGTQFRIPTSSSNPLPFSTTFGYTDLLGVMYNQPANKWDVISFVPGYY